MIFAGALAAGLAFQTSAATLPFSDKFTSSMGEFTAVDANADGETIEFYNSNYGKDADGCLRLAGDNPSDDWLLSPEFEMREGYVYTISFYTQNWIGRNVYNLEAKLVEDADDLAEGEPDFTTTCSSYNYNEVSFEVSPPATGTYHIAVHFWTETNQGPLYIDDFSVSEGLFGNRPAAPQAGIPSFSKEEDRLVTSFSVTAPTLNSAGNALEAFTQLTLRVTRSDDEEYAVTSGVLQPGAVWEFTDSDAPLASVQYTVRALEGDIEGDAITVGANPALPVPAAVGNLAISKEGLNNFTLTWDPVTTGATTGIFFPSKVTYTVRCNQVIIANGLTDTTLEYTYPDAPEHGQIVVNFSVVAVNNSGSSAETRTPAQTVGNPYTGHYAESFAGWTYTTSTWSVEGSSNWAPSVGSSYPPVVSPQDADGGLLTTNSSAESLLVSPVINMAGEPNPGLKLWMWNQADYYYDVPVTVGFRSGGEDTDAATYNTKDTTIPTGWHEKFIPVPEAVAAGDFQIYFYTSGNYGKVFIDNITVQAYRDHSLALTALEVPETAEIGKTVELKARLSNLGTMAAEGYKVTFYADGETLGETEGSEAIAGQTDASVTFSFKVLPKYAGSTLALSAILTYEADEVTDDNEADAELTVNENSLNVPTGLSATVSGQDVTLEWTAPEVSTEATIEAVMEDFESWELGATTAVAGWTFIDVDGQSKMVSITGGYSSSTFGALVVGPYTPSYGSGFSPRSGDRAVVFGKAFNYGALTDSWIVSPEVAPGTTVSFYAMGYFGYGTYSDNVQLLWSAGGTSTSDFNLLSTFEVSGGAWTECTATLPDEARRFAIRFSGAMRNDNIAIDDVAYFVGSEPPVLTGYGVYRNEELVATLPSDILTYTDASLLSGEHTHYVTAIYNVGESMASEAVTSVIGETDGVASIPAGVSVYSGNGTLTVEGAEGMAVAVADISGKLLTRGTGNVNLAVAPGIYIVSINGAAVTLIVK